MLESCYLGFVEFCFLLYLLREMKEKGQQSLRLQSQMRGLKPVPII